MHWAVRRETGTVAELHERSADALVDAAVLGRTVLVMEPRDSALVLGSSQRADVADAVACREAGVSVVRRRSGGGAVVVRPGAQLWVDLVLPAGDLLWDSDVGRAAWWVGEAWAAALAASGLAGAEVWKGPLVRRPWSSLACFALLGAGEVVAEGPAGEGAAGADVGAGEGTAGGEGERAAGANSPKVVGISQRRTRAGALFQCSCLLQWEPSELVTLLAVAPGQRERAAKELGHAALAAPAREREKLLERLIEALPGSRRLA